MWSKSLYIPVDSRGHHYHHVFSCQENQQFTFTCSYVAYDDAPYWKVLACFTTYLDTNDTNQIIEEKRFSGSLENFIKWHSVTFNVFNQNT